MKKLERRRKSRSLDALGTRLDLLRMRVELEEQALGIRGRRTLCRTVRDRRGKKVVRSTTLVGSPDEVESLDIYLMRLRARRGIGRCEVRPHWLY
jgi:hypothetical protein